MYIRDGSAMATWVRVFAKLLLLIFIVTASSHVAYAGSERPRTATRAVEVAKPYENLGDWQAGPEEGVGEKPPATNADGQVKQEERSANYDELWADNALTSGAILRIADYLDYVNSNSDVQLAQMLEEIGYKPLSYNVWIALPAVHKIEIAYHAAESARPGGGQALLVNVVHKLAARYESIRYDDELKAFIKADVQSISFRHWPGVPPSGLLPSGIREIINAIERYCGNCSILGGIKGILENYLGLGEDEALQILRHSMSNGQAFLEAVSRLDEPVANGRIRKMIEDLQKYYEGARHDEIFNEFMDAPAQHQLESVATCCRVVAPHGPSKGPVESPETTEGPDGAGDLDLGVELFEPAPRLPPDLVIP